MLDLTLVSQIRIGIDPEKIATLIEGMLYAKSSKKLEQVKLQEAAAMLNEADPTPRIWKNEKGEPVVPSPADWARHYEELAAGHVRDQVNAAKSRWADAVKKAEASGASKFDAAEVKNLKMNISAGERALKQKMTATTKLHKVQTAKLSKHKKNLYNTFRKALHPFVGGSPLLGHILHHATNAAADYMSKNKGSSAQKA